MTPLPTQLYRAKQIRAMDAYAIDTLGIPGIELMNRAGAAAFAALRQRWPTARTLSVLCGAGSNGGDGYVLARLALQAGFDVRVYPVSEPESLSGDALTAYQHYRAADGPVLDFIPADFEGAQVLADGLFGTGLNRPVEGVHADILRAANRFRGGKLALDIPSGLNADSGQAQGIAFKADLTVTFIGLKQGLFTADGPEHCGAVVFDDLNTPPAVQASQTAAARLPPPWTGGLPRRARNAHKGQCGHVLVLGGAPGFSGAARLAAEAAARCGAGLVSVATHPAHAALLNLSRPELMCHAVASPADLRPLLARVTVIAVGPGLGQEAWGRELFAAALDAGLPLVVDADALNLLAQNPIKREDWILTPHPGEAARLLGGDSRTVQADRFAAIEHLQQRYGGALVLKGSGSLIRGPQGLTAVCPQGNPGMASGGMGDVLTGVIAALLAQGLPLTAAAETGVRLHAAAADLAAANGGEIGLLASDLYPYLRNEMNR